MSWTERRKVLQQQRRSREPQPWLVKSVVQRCRYSGVPCDKEYLLSMVCPPVCKYLGTPISFETGKGHRPAQNTASFDQKLPGKGYVPGNVEIISLKANVMKHNASPQELASFAIAVLKDQGLV